VNLTEFRVQVRVGIEKEVPPTEQELGVIAEHVRKYVEYGVAVANSNLCSNDNEKPPYSYKLQSSTIILDPAK